MKRVNILAVVVLSTILSFSSFVTSFSSFSLSSALHPTDLSFAIGGGNRRRHSATILQAKSSSSDNEQHGNQKNHDESSSMSELRKERLAKESVNSKRFASGEELKSLREDLESLRHNLEWAKALKDDARIESLQNAITNGQNRDPYFMYTKALRLISEARKMKDASQEEKDALIEKWTSVATSAKTFLPEFSMEGLWVGK
jgi:hypothetical protein